MSTTPRLLQVLYSYEIGGSEIVGLELARQMAANGAKVMCAALKPADGPLKAKCLEYGIEPLELRIREQSYFGRNGCSLELARWVKKLELSGIHLHHFLGLHRLGLPARLAGVPHIVMTEHSIASLQASAYSRVRARVAWRLAHHLTAVSDNIRDYLVGQLGVSPARISVIQNGIELKHWHRTDREQRRHEFGVGKQFVFAFVGRLADVKNIPGLLRAFLRMQSERSDLECGLLIVGDGVDMVECRAILAQHPLGARVQLLGERSDARIPLAAADAFVMNSLSEGSPRAMIEAMAIGLPCVCPAVGGVPALLRDRGWLTEPQSEPDLARALAEVAADPFNAARVGALGQAHVMGQFDARHSLVRYLRLFGIAAP